MAKIPKVVESWKIYSAKNPATISRIFVTFLVFANFASGHKNTKKINKMSEWPFAMDLHVIIVDTAN